MITSLRTYYDQSYPPAFSPSVTSNIAAPSGARRKSINDLPPPTYWTGILACEIIFDLSPVERCNTFSHLVRSPGIYVTVPLVGFSKQYLLPITSPVSPVTQPGTGYLRLRLVQLKPGPQWESLRHLKLHPLALILNEFRKVVGLVVFGVVIVGLDVGLFVRLFVGFDVGQFVGHDVGQLVGLDVGQLVGLDDGLDVGVNVGL